MKVWESTTLCSAASTSFLMQECWAFRSSRGTGIVLRGQLVVGGEDIRCENTEFSIEKSIVILSAAKDLLPFRRFFGRFALSE
jgi:hypothetical protein